MEKRIGIVTPESRLRCLNCLNSWQIDQLRIEEDNLNIGCCPICEVVLAVQRVTIKQTELTFTEDAELL